MFIKILGYYLLGYINISVEGYFIERFINMCISKKILLWNLKRTKSSFLYVNVGIREFKKIKEIAKITKCRIKIEKKKGMPFILNRYKKRKPFFVALLLLILLIIAMSNFVWNIEVVGASSIDANEIVENLQNDGLKVGTLKAKINTKEIINKLRLERSDIAWVGIHLRGTNAIVEIVEADKKPDIVDENELCNIVSDKEGIITKISVQNGTALVKEGDIVKKR